MTAHNSGTHIKNSHRRGIGGDQYAIDMSSGEVFTFKASTYVYNCVRVVHQHLGDRLGWEAVRVL